MGCGDSGDVGCRDMAFGIEGGGSCDGCGCDALMQERLLHPVVMLGLHWQKVVLWLLDGWDSGGCGAGLWAVDDGGVGLLLSLVSSLDLGDCRAVQRILRRCSGILVGACCAIKKSSSLMRRVISASVLWNPKFRWGLLANQSSK